MPAEAVLPDVDARLLLPEADECVDPSGRPRRGYAKLLSTLGPERDALRALQARVRRWFAAREITFGAPEDDDGPAPIFPFDPLPRVIGATEWTHLQRGLAQRAMALDAFVADCYGSQRALRDGIVPGRIVYTSRGYLRDIVGTAPPRGSWCHIAGIDLVRVDGEFRVLEDNVRVPSGIAYALVSRDAMLDAAPGWLMAMHVRPIDDYPRRLRHCLQRIAPRQWEANIAVLTPGRYNAAYYEHRLLAEGLGGSLVEGRDLVVSDDEVYRRTPEGDIERIDVIYSRINSEWIDSLVFRSDSLLGAPGLVEAWRRGNVAIANAPGTGVADDKAVYAYIPNLIRYYLGEDPVLENVATYDLTDAAQRAHVFQTMERMVLKPVDASGGYGICFGRSMTRAEREELTAEIEAAPRHWLAQEEVHLSRAVCLGRRGGFEARAVDLRPFVLLDERPWIVPGGLTRVAPHPDTQVVNSSQGGGSKDTWVLSR